MGVEKALMEGLSDRFAAIESRKTLLELAAKSKGTPEDFTTFDGKTANQIVLRVATEGFDAYVTRAPGTEPLKALGLMESVLDFQKKGYMTIGGRNELFTSTHAQLWDAGMAAMLFVARHAGLQDLQMDLASWWRQRYDTWGVHLALDDRRKPVVLMPCLRGARIVPPKGGYPGGPKPEMAVNESQNRILRLLRTRMQGEAIRPENRYLVGARIWQRMLDQKLQQPPAGYFPMPEGFDVEILEAEDGEWVSMMPALPGSDPQWMVGTTKERPEGAFDVPGTNGWVVFRSKKEWSGPACPVRLPVAGKFIPRPYWNTSRKEA